MDLSVILAFGSAILAIAIALTVAWHERRSLAHWLFVAGMGVFAAESVLSALSADAVAPQEIVRWQNYRLASMALLPGIWLLFSLTYARGNYKDFLSKWRFPLGAAFLAPIALVLLAAGSLVTS